MNFYEKIFLSTYSSFAKTNKWHPAWSAASALSTLHIINLLSIGLLTGYKSDTMEKQQFIIVSSGLFCFLLWAHFALYVKGKSLSNRVKVLDAKTRFWSGLAFLLYAIGTFFIFFRILDTSWTPFIILSIIFIGLALNFYLFKKEN